MKIAIINGHPNKKSFNTAIAKAYEKGAKKSKHEIKIINVRDMKFDIKEMDEKNNKDIKEAQKIISWANHLVFIFPNWWTTMPALMKGFFDKVFTKEYAFRFISKINWDKLLLGKSARVIVTMGTPTFIYKVFMKNPIKQNLKGTLNFCGIKPVKYTCIGSFADLTKNQRTEWLNKIEKIAMKE